MEIYDIWEQFLCAKTPQERQAIIESTTPVQLKQVYDASSRLAKFADWHLRKASKGLNPTDASGLIKSVIDAQRKHNDDILAATDAWYTLVEQSPQDVLKGAVAFHGVVDKVTSKVWAKRKMSDVAYEDTI